MSDDMLPAGAANDPRAPYNEIDNDIVCPYCRESAPKGIGEGDLFDCTSCREGVEATSEQQLRKDAYDDAMEAKAEERREEGRYDND